MNRDGCTSTIRAIMNLAEVNVMALRQLPHDWVFYWQHRNSLHLPIPSPILRYKAIDKWDIVWFHESGRQSRQDLERALSVLCRPIHSFRCVMDFGVGGSRIMRWMGDLSDTGMLVGTDIDRMSIRWSEKHIPYAQFYINCPIPPLPFPSHTFDLIYSYSVFSHLDEAVADMWLAELHRVSIPGAALLLTVQGQATWERRAQSLSGSERERMQQRYTLHGFLFDPNDGWAGLFPLFYQTAFHTAAYVERKWSEGFRVVAYLERAMLDQQDIVVLERL